MEGRRGGGALGNNGSGLGAYEALVVRLAAEREREAAERQEAAHNETDNAASAVHCTHTTRDRLFLVNQLNHTSCDASPLDRSINRDVY